MRTAGQLCRLSFGLAFAISLLQGVETCIEEEFWNGEQCVQCNSTSCAIGHFRIACTNATDSMCLPCSGNPSNSFFVANGIRSPDNCSWLCLPGYDEVSGECLPCTPCPPGQYREICGYQLIEIERRADGQDDCSDACRASSAIFENSQFVNAGPADKCRCLKKSVTARECKSYATHNQSKQTGVGSFVTAHTFTSFDKQMLVGRDVTSQIHKAVRSSPEYLAYSDCVDENGCLAGSCGRSCGANPLNDSQLFIQECFGHCSTDAACACVALVSEEDTRKWLLPRSCILARHPCTLSPWKYDMVRPPTPTSQVIAAASDAVWIKSLEVTLCGSGANRSCSCPAGQYLGFRRPSKCMSRRSVFIEELGPFSYKQQLQSCAATSILQHSTTFCLESSSNLCFTGTQEMSVDGECFELPGLGRKEVFYVDQKVTWKEAELGCIQKGGQLASSFEDPVELLRAAAKFRFAWTGRNRRQSPFPYAPYSHLGEGLCEVVEVGTYGAGYTQRTYVTQFESDCTNFYGYLCEKDSVQCFDTAEMQCFSCTNVPFAGSHWHYTGDGMLTSACPAECDSGHGVNWGEHCSSRTRAAVGCVLGLIAIAATFMLILRAGAFGAFEARRCMLCSLRKPQCATTGLFRPCRNHCSSSNHSALLDEQLKCESCQFDLQTRPLRMCCPLQAVCEGVMESDSEWLFPSIWTILQLALSRVQSPGPHRLIAEVSSLLVVAALFNGAVWGFVDVSEDLAAAPALNPFAFARMGNTLFVSCLVSSWLFLAAVERGVCCSCANRKVQCSFCKLADLYETLGVPGASASCTLADARPPTRLCLERSCISVLVGEPCLLPSPTQHASNSDDAIRCVPPARFLLAKRRDWDDSNEDCCWSLPVGLQLNALTGEITGTPQAITAGMKYVVNVVVFNPLGVCSVQMTLSVFARPTPPTNILYPSIVPVARIAVQDCRVCDSCCRESLGPHWYCNDCRTRRYVICDACHTMSFAIRERNHDERHHFRCLYHAFNDSAVELRHHDPGVMGKEAIVVTAREEYEESDVVSTTLAFTAVQLEQWVVIWMAGTMSSWMFVLLALLIYRPQLLLFFGLLALIIPQAALWLVLWLRSRLNHRPSYKKQSEQYEVLVSEYRDEGKHSCASPPRRMHSVECISTECISTEEGRIGATLVWPIAPLAGHPTHEQAATSLESAETRRSSTMHQRVTVTDEEIAVKGFKRIPAGALVQWKPSNVFSCGFPAPTFTLAGTRPEGLHLDQHSGELHGTVLTAGTSSFIVIATNGQESSSVQTSITLEVVNSVAEGGLMLSYSTSDPRFNKNPSRFTGLQYQMLESIDMSPNLFWNRPRLKTTFSITPVLPPFLSFCRRTGRIWSDREAERLPLPTTSYTVTAWCSEGFVTTKVRLKISQMDPPAIPPSFSYLGGEEEAISLMVGKEAFIEAEHIFHDSCISSTVEPSLPGGLSIDEDGNIVGVPAHSAGLHTYKVGITRFDYLNPSRWPRNDRSTASIQLLVKGSKKPRCLIFLPRDYSETQQMKLNVGREGEDLQQATHRHRSLELSVHAQPTFSDFRDAMEHAKSQNVQVVILSGHGDTKQGFQFLKDEAGLESEWVPAEHVQSVLADQCTSNDGVLECVVLNACHTKHIGSELRKAGIPHVICWEEAVPDSMAMVFTRFFYSALLILAKRDEVVPLPDTAYRLAYAVGKRAREVLKLREGVQALRSKKATTMVHRGDESSLWFLSQNGDESDAPYPVPTTRSAVRDEASLASEAGPSGGADSDTDIITEVVRPPTDEGNMEAFEDEVDVIFLKLSREYKLSTDQK